MRKKAKHSTFHLNPLQREKIKSREVRGNIKEIRTEYMGKYSSNDNKII